MRIAAPSTILLSSLLLTTSVSALRPRDADYGSLYARDYDDYLGLYARDAYAYPEPVAYDDDFSLYTRNAEPDVVLEARDAYLDGYLAGLAKRDDLWIREPGNLFSKGNDDRPDWQKDMDGWENDKNRKKKQKDLDKYVRDQQKKREKQDKKDSKGKGK